MASKQVMRVKAKPRTGQARQGKAQAAAKAPRAPGRDGKGSKASTAKAGVKPAAAKPKATSKSTRSSKAARSSGKAKTQPTKASKALASKSASKSSAASKSESKGSAASKPASKSSAASKSASKAPTSSGKGDPKPSKAPKAAEDGADLSVAGQIYRNGKLVEGVLHIDTETGRIVRLAKSTELPRHLDFGSSLILPGGIDVHVHFREPGHTHKEDLRSGSIAAAYGGITGYVDMPNTLPATTTLRSLKDKLALMAAKSVVDYAAWAGGSWYVGDLPQMLRHAVGVKTYLGATTGDLLLDDTERFNQIVAACGQAGRPLMLHAESNRILQQLRRQEGTVADHDTFRPPLAEVEAIYDTMKALATAKKPPHVHIAHASSAEAVQAAASAKFSVGVTPHHILLDTSAPLTHAYGKVNPPLRGPAVRKAVFEQFAKGRIPILESDHAPHTTVEKEDNFHTAPAGMPGVETMYPLMLAQVKAGKLQLSHVVDALTVNPATLIGANDRGALEPGLRADFAVFDLKATTKVQGAKLRSQCGWSPFEGHTAIFPTHTFLAGKAVMQEGELMVEPGHGKSILPQPKE